MTAWAVGVCAYYYAFLGWGRKELRAIDVLTRKILCEHKAHHPQAAIERLYLPRKKGGRGMLCIEHAYEREMVLMAFYLATVNDPD